MPLELIDSADGTLHVKASGPLAPDSPEHFTAELLALAGPKLFSLNLTLDLAETEFISSAGIGGLLQSNRRFEAERGNLVVKSPSRNVRQALELMRLDTVLQIE